MKSPLLFLLALSIVPLDAVSQADYHNRGPRGTANHIHSIWREKGNEYGEDLLKKHYSAEKH